MDGFFTRKLCPNRCYLTFFHIPNVGSPQKTEIDPNLPIKCYSKVARILIYIGLLSVAQTV
jgi:hypothetical protein